jgi:hypothetical protein
VHRLSSSFVLGFHGCDRRVGEKLVAGEPFKPSRNDYDWLGPGIYFWENNWKRGLDFAREHMRRNASEIKDPSVIGAVIDLGACLDLTTKASIDLVRTAREVLVNELRRRGLPLPANSPDRLRHDLDCAVIKRAHHMAAEDPRLGPIQTVKGVFLEGKRAYPGSAFHEKTHVQIAVYDPSCIKGVFHVRRFG